MLQDKRPNIFIEPGEQFFPTSAVSTTFDASMPVLSPGVSKRLTHAHRVFRAGSYFDVDVRLPPFNLTEPLRVYNEHSSKLAATPEKYLLLYSTEYLRSKDWDAVVEAAMAYKPAPPDGTVVL